MQFGTSGLRGLVAEMTDEAVAAWTAAFLAHIAASGAQPLAVLVGRDLRPSSPRIAAAVLGAVRDAGANAVDCGVLPTPALALDAAARRAPAVMVSGSHIPFDRNGLKFYLPEGEIAKADEAGIRAALDRPAPPAPVLGAAIADPDARTRYLARMRRFFPCGALAGRRIGIWQHSAAGRDLTVDALAALGAETIELGRTDDFVAIDTEALAPEHLRLVLGWVEAHRLDALVATDGDGDRPLVADETGVVLRGDLLGLLTARILGADAVATPVSSNSALERSGWISRVLRTRIGSPFVIEAMALLAAEGARLPVGYEANGGVLLGGTAVAPSGATLAPLPTRDALLPMLAVLTEASRRGLPVSALAAEAPARFTASDRLTAFPPTASATLLAALADDPRARARLVARLGGPEIVALDLTDGVRMTLSSDEVAHLRASGNAPELRAYAEAATHGRAEKIVAQMLGAVAATAL